MYKDLTKEEEEEVESGVSVGSSDDEDEEPRRRSCLRNCRVAALVLLSVGWLLVLPIIGTTRAFQIGRCDPAGLNATLQALPPLHYVETGPWERLKGSFLWSETNVFDPEVSNSSRVGYWTDSTYFGLYTTFEYVSGAGDTLVKASPSFAKFFGKEWTIQRCGSARTFRISEDYWAEPWFQFLSKTEIYRIYEADTLIGTAEHSQTWKGLEPPSWSAVVRRPDGEEVALMQQEFENYFSTSHWRVRNARPDELPTYVASFLCAVYDMGRSGSSGRRSSGRSSSRKR